MKTPKDDRFVVFVVSQALHNSPLVLLAYRTETDENGEKQPFANVLESGLCGEIKPCDSTPRHAARRRAQQHGREFLAAYGPLEPEELEPLDGLPPTRWFLARMDFRPLINHKDVPAGIWRPCGYSLLRAELDTFPSVDITAVDQPPPRALGIRSDHLAMLKQRVLPKFS